METVRKSAKVTWTLIVIAVAAIIMHYWYLAADFDYFYMVKAFMQTRAEIGGMHSFLINRAFWVSVIVGVVNAALSYKYGFSIISVLWVPVLIMCGLALLFIPDTGFTNIRLFWFICYILMVVGTWFSARQVTRFCLENSNLSALLKDPGTKLEVKIDRIDFIAAMLLMIVSYILMGLVVIGVLIFSVKNWDLITGSDDITPVVSSIRYDAAAEFMDEGEYEKAMIEFRNLEDYKDSQTMAAKCEDLLYRPIYLEAIRLMDQGEYDEARSLFWSIYGYKKSARKIEKCDNLQYGLQYDEAVALMREGLYEDALEIFEMLFDIGYKDTSKKIENCRRIMKASLSGTWQGNAGSRLTLRKDLTCDYVDGSGPTGDGTWDVIDGRLIVQTDALYYELYGDLDNGYLTTSVLIKADASSWSDETFTKE